MRQPINVRPYLLVLVLFASACANQPEPATERVRLLGLTELAATFDQTKISRCLGREPSAAVNPTQLESLQATALLNCLQHNGQSLLDTELFGQLRDNGSPAWLTNNRQQVADLEMRLQKAMAAGLSTRLQRGPGKPLAWVRPSKDVDLRGTAPGNTPANWWRCCTPKVCGPG